MKFLVLTDCNTSAQEIQQGPALREKRAISGLLSSYSLVPQVEAENICEAIQSDLAAHFLEQNSWLLFNFKHRRLN